ncbi:hypothetical protein CC79DRAFT_1164004 [Sarocladium strictum]
MLANLRPRRWKMMSDYKKFAKRFLFATPKPIVSSDSRDNPQQAALLLQRLPTEIRSQIWNAYFYSPETNIIHIRYNIANSAECITEDRSNFTINNHRTCYHTKERRDRISLLLICRRIYFECAPFLYETALFDFSTSTEAVAHFRDAISPTHFACISQVSMSFPLGSRNVPRLPAQTGSTPGKPKDDATKYWLLMWKTLGEMENLRWLRFEVRLINYPLEGPTWRKNRDAILGPMKQVTQPLYFELIMPFEVNHYWMDTLPCHVIRFDDTPA